MLKFYEIKNLIRESMQQLEVTANSNIDVLDKINKRIDRIYNCMEAAKNSTLEATKIINEAEQSTSAENTQLHLNKIRSMICSPVLDNANKVIQETEYMVIDYLELMTNQGFQDLIYQNLNKISYLVCESHDKSLPADKKRQRITSSISDEPAYVSGNASDERKSQSEVDKMLEDLGLIN